MTDFKALARKGFEAQREREAAGRAAPRMMFAEKALGYDAPWPVREKRVDHGPNEAPAPFRRRATPPQRTQGTYRRANIALPSVGSPPIKSRTEGGLDRAIAHEDRE